MHAHTYLILISYDSVEKIDHIEEPSIDLLIYLIIANINRNFDIKPIK